MTSAWGDDCSARNLKGHNSKLHLPHTTPCHLDCILQTWLACRFQFGTIAERLEHILRIAYKRVCMEMVQVETRSYQTSRRHVRQCHRACQRCRSDPGDSGQTIPRQIRARTAVIGRIELDACHGPSSLLTGRGGE